MAHLSFARIFILMLTLIALGFTQTARSQSALDGFDPNANNAVRVVLPQPDGKILIAGDFTSLAPNGGPSVTRNRIARLNPDGSLDTAFNPNANSLILTLALQTDGKILAGGVFTNIGGQPRGFIARLDAVTGLADSFNPAANNIVYTIAVQPDGMILTGGDFTTISGQSRGRLARLDPTTGAADSLNGSADTVVFTLLVQTDGKILVGGNFTTLGGQLRAHIARLDPSTGTPDGFNPGANDNVLCFAAQPDGKILVGGIFTTIGGQSRNRIARLDPNTGLADSFNPNAPGVSDAVNVITLQTDGQILVGGTFTTIGGQSRNNIARLNRSNGLADGFNPNANAFVNAKAIAIQPDGKILIGGGFTNLIPNGGAAIARNRVARLETDGRADRTLNDLQLGTNGLITAIALQPDGRILIGGSFTSVLGVTQNNIARLNTDGTLDLLFNPDPNGDVASIAVQADGKILVGGGFTVIGGQTRSGIARLSGGTADSFNPNANGYVLSIAVQPDGKVLAGGGFDSIGGQTRIGIARLDAVTGLADGFNSNGNGEIHSIAVQADGKILVGGGFTSIGGQTRSCIARLDPVAGMADSFNPNANGEVNSIAVQADGKILAGGHFSSIGGQTRNRIARLDPLLGLADAFNPNANGDIFSTAFQADGRILVGGGFTSIGGQPRLGLARLDAATGLADLFTAGPDNTVYAVAVQPDGKILAGGSFNIIGGQTRGRFARLSNDTVAAQNLSVTQTSVTWTRSGSGPQFSRATFEDSTDGVNYNFLGNGTPSGNNWTLSCLNLSTGQNIYIRARGYYHGSFYNGSESIQESVRNAFLTPGPAISGTVTYGNAIGAPTPRFVSNVLLSGAGSPNVMTTTASPGPCAGTYLLNGFGAGSYTVTPSKTGGVNGISSFDAAKIAAHVSGTALLTGNQIVVADVSGNGIVSSFDAAQIAQFVANGSGMQTGTWKFVPANRSYASVTSSASGEDFIALLMGEVSGNWTNAGARSTNH